MTSSRSRFQPDWVLNINRIAATFHESTPELPISAVHEVASPVASTNTPTIVSSQTPDIESGSVVEKRDGDIESLKRPTPLVKLEA